MINIYGNDKNNSHLKVGELYDIQTKKGIVQKYLSYVCKWTRILYFVDDKRNVLKKNYTNMYAKRGTAHSTKNVIGLSK